MSVLLFTVLCHFISSLGQISNFLFLAKKKITKISYLDLDQSFLSKDECLKECFVSQSQFIFLGLQHIQCHGMTVQTVFIKQLGMVFTLVFVDEVNQIDHRRQNAPQVAYNQPSLIYVTSPPAPTLCHPRQNGGDIENWGGSDQIAVLENQMVLFRGANKTQIFVQPTKQICINNNGKGRVDLL